MIFFNFLGEFDYVFDRKHNILVCRWQDNKEVTVATNYDQIRPTKPAKRWQRKKVNADNIVVEKAKEVTFQQPQVLYNYNQGMGGVDLHDNGVQNYRIHIRSKKWYWPLFISGVDSAIVNAWKLQCFLRKCDKNKLFLSWISA